jgi:predicted nucleotidyltransferase
VIAIAGYVVHLHTVRFFEILFPDMRTSAPRLLPLFRSEMQLRLLGLLLLQPERSFTLSELAKALDAPSSSVHRELERAEDAGIILRDATSRPHQFRAAADDPVAELLSALLTRTVGIETALAETLDRPDVYLALIYGSWATGKRRPDSDVDVLVVGSADLRDLRRAVRPIGKAAGRTIDVTTFAPREFQELIRDKSSFARRILDEPTLTLTGDLEETIGK